MKLYIGHVDTLEQVFWVTEITATYDEKIKSYELVKPIRINYLVSSKWIEENELNKVKVSESIDGGDNYILISKNKEEVESFVKNEFDAYKAKLLKNIENLEKNGIKHYYYD